MTTIPGDIKSPLEVYDQLYKDVDYYGYNITVPVWAKHIAMDADGAIFAYEAPPTAYEGKWCHLACYKVQLVHELTDVSTLGPAWYESYRSIR